MALIGPMPIETVGNSQKSGISHGCGYKVPYKYAAVVQVGISVNIGDPVIVKWRGKEVKTGIYKYPVNKSIHLGFEDVDQDHNG